MAARTEAVSLTAAVGFGAAALLLTPSVGYVALYDEGSWVARGVMFVPLVGAWCGLTTYLAARGRRRSP